MITVGELVSGRGVWGTHLLASRASSDASEAPPPSQLHPSAKRTKSVCPLPRARQGGYSPPAGSPSRVQSAVSSWRPERGIPEVDATCARSDPGSTLSGTHGVPRTRGTHGVTLDTGDVRGTLDTGDARGTLDTGDARGNSRHGGRTGYPGHGGRRKYARRDARGTLDTGDAGRVGKGWLAVSVTAPMPCCSPDSQLYGR
eukprot:9482490-Pyramimonas_sp.AAC.1